MSIKPRTVDDLGIDASNQYARNQAALDPRLMEESRLFPSKIEGGLNPYISAEGEESYAKFTIGQAVIWANFSPPQDYGVKASRLFTYQLIPSLGGSERLQAISDKLESLDRSVIISLESPKTMILEHGLHRNEERRQGEHGHEQEDQPEQERERKRMHEYKMFCSFIKMMIDSFRTFELIKSRCNQYQRG